MFNIIKTLQNYFTHELLPDCLISKVALNSSVNQWQPFWVVSFSEEALTMASAAPVHITT